MITKRDKMSEVSLVIHEDGRATLTIEGVQLHVGRCSGLDDAIKVFNKAMRDRGLSFRLACGIAETMHDILNRNS